MNKTKRNKKGFIYEVIEVFLLSLLIILFIALIYLIYYNIPGNPENPMIIIEDMNDQESAYNSSLEQFYPNLKFNHNNISYYIDPFCEISYKVDILDFYSGLSNSDIEISCSPEKKESADSEHFIAGEGGPKEIVQTGRFNVVIYGTVFLFGDKKDLPECSWPNIELHELMHVFGFNHTDNKKSLMYPYLESCNKVFDDSLVAELNRLYSIPNLPDLYFENLSAIKKGRYLDFNLTIKNSGDIDSGDVNLSIFDEGKLIESSKLGNVRFGAGVYLEIKNLKLIHRNSKEISFVIDYSNKIKEFDKSNNLAIVKFE